VQVCDETGWGFGWIAPELAVQQRCSHALAVDGRVWVVDPTDVGGVEERVRALGVPGGVIQLVDRHKRDCAELASRLGVPHHVLPLGTLSELPFEFLLVRKGRFWKEVALWWESERVLCCGDALGTASYFLARGERLAVHPLLRPLPPRRRLGGVSPRHVLCGHGAGVHGDEAEAAFRTALATARRRIPAWAVSLARR
jgi:hypothetical protein